MIKKILLILAIFLIALLVSFFKDRFEGDGDPYLRPFGREENRLFVLDDFLSWDLNLFTVSFWVDGYGSLEQKWVSSINENIESNFPKKDFILYTIDSLFDEGQKKTIACAIFSYMNDQIVQMDDYNKTIFYHYDMQGDIDVKKTVYKDRIIPYIGWPLIDVKEERRYVHGDSIILIERFYDGDSLMRYNKTSFVETLHKIGNKSRMKVIYNDDNYNDLNTGFLFVEKTDDGSVKKIIRRDSSDVKEYAMLLECTTDFCKEIKEDGNYKYENYKEKKKGQVIFEKIEVNYSKVFFWPSERLFSGTITYGYSPEGNLIEKIYSNDETEEQYREIFSYNGGYEKAWFVNSVNDTLGWVFKKNGRVEEISMSFRMTDEKRKGYRIVRFSESQKIKDCL